MAQRNWIFRSPRMEISVNIRFLEYIIKMEQTGNMTQAAKELYVSQSSLSQFLSNEEKKIKKKLFTRINGKYVPTAAGKLYINYAKKVIELTNQFNYRMSNISTQNIINIGTISSAAVKMLATILPKFKDLYPDIQPNIIHCTSLTSAVKDLANNTLDIAFGTAHSSNLYSGTSKMLSKEEIVLGVPMELIENTSYQYLPTTEITAQQVIHFFGNCPFILQYKGNCIRHLIDAFFQDTLFEPNVTCNTSDIFAITDMIKNGLGLGFISTNKLAPSPKIKYLSLSPKIYRLHTVYIGKDYAVNPVSDRLIELASQYYSTSFGYNPA